MSELQKIIQELEAITNTSVPLQESSENDSANLYKRMEEVEKQVAFLFTILPISGTEITKEKDKPDV